MADYQKPLPAMQYKQRTTKKYGYNERMTFSPSIRKPGPEKNAMQKCGSIFPTQQDQPCSVAELHHRGHPGGVDVDSSGRNRRRRRARER